MDEIPFFKEVYETHVPPDRRSVVLIAPDPAAGHRNRYSVIRVWLANGEARCIGRELPLQLARRVCWEHG